MERADVIVIIPCYRCADTVARAVESVINQTLIPLGIILIDDGNDDESLQVLRNLQIEYGVDLISIISFEKNLGVSAARNAGWDRATSTYVAFLDADDIWHPKKIELQYIWMKDHPEVAICGHKSVMVDPEDFPEMTQIHHKPLVSMIPVQRLLMSNPFSTPSIVLKRDLPYRFDCAQHYTEDFLLIMQIGTDGNIVARIEEDLAYIFKRPGKTGASRYIWKMRVGDLLNYYKLWQSKRINVIQFCTLGLHSLLKFSVMLTLGVRTYFSLKSWVDNIKPND